MKTSDLDIRKIRIFIGVVQCGGFSAAQDLLNLTQSTISSEIAALETRLGYTLCTRGRRGFQLTPQGEAFLSDAKNLLTSISQFEHSVSRHKLREIAEVRIGIIDNLVTDPSCPLIEAIDKFLKKFGVSKTHIRIDVMPPDDIVRNVVSGRVDMGIGIFTNAPTNLTSQTLYSERDVLVCGRSHPLYSSTDNIDLFSRVRDASKVVRTFLNLDDFFFLSDQRDSITAYVDSVEAIAIIVLAGHHLGFLPDHYAQRWIEAGEMKILLEKSYTRKSKIELLHLRDTSRLSGAAKTLIAGLTRRAARGPHLKAGSVAD